ncbi:alpha/beta hydrolase-fold protein [Phytomonospora sp. NPDC050363]|uniref:alpha/beta hydrolase n=1 Tax=Phytomonospora sp. NPDC050363 TaxID=3155642 RepID=UPI0033CE73D4
MWRCSPTGFSTWETPVHRAGAESIAGQSLGGLAALHAAQQAPDLVGLALAQSASLNWVTDADAATAALPAAQEASTTGGVRYFLEVGRHEPTLLEPNRRLHRALRDAGADVVYREFQGGHDYTCWRGGLADGLLALLGGA